MKNRRVKVTGIIVLMVFCIFAVCIMAVLFTGADVYGRLADSAGEQFDKRTAVRYLTTRVRQSDVAGDLWIEDFDGVSTLVFREEFEGEYYLTRVYCYEGYIRELFTSAEGIFLPRDGEKVLKAEGLDFTLEGELLTIELILADQTKQSLQLYLRSHRGGES